MFVIELVYKADLSEIDAHMGTHVRFLNKYLAVGKSLKEVEAIVREDPFHQHGLAEFRIIEFRASQRADDISKRISSG